MCTHFLFYQEPVETAWNIGTTTLEGDWGLPVVLCLSSTSLHLAARHLTARFLDAISFREVSPSPSALHTSFLVLPSPPLLFPPFPFPSLGMCETCARDSLTLTQVVEGKLPKRKEGCVHGRGLPSFLIPTQACSNNKETRRYLQTEDIRHL